MSWTKTELAALRRLAGGRLFAREIAERLGKSPQVVCYKMRQLGLDPAGRAKRSGRYGKWNAKHAHLRERAMRYFMTHTFEETMERFKLTRSELRALQTIAYRRPELAHLRKDRRRHDVWSFEETMFLLRHAGLQPRSWIAARLRRGTMQSVKEMVSRLGANTRYINGLPARLASELVGHDVAGFRVKAGPDGRHAGVDCRPIIVPWVVLYSEAKKSASVPPHLVDALRAMSRFQKRIHGTRGILDTVESVLRGVAGRKVRSDRGAQKTTTEPRKVRRQPRLPAPVRGPKMVRGTK